MGSPTDAPSPSLLGSRVQSVLAALVDWAWLTSLIACAPAFGLWPLLQPDNGRAFYSGRLHAGDLSQLGWFLVASWVVVWGAYLAGWLFAQRTKPSRPFRDFARTCNHACVGLLAAPIVSRILVPGFEVQHPWWCLIWIFVAGALLAWTTADHLRRRQGTPGRPRRWGRRLTVILVGGLALAYAGLFSWLSVLDHWNLGTNQLDLAIYDNVLWRTAHGDFLGCSICPGETHASSHFDPFLVALAPIYRIWPRAETLLIVQSVWLASGVAPLGLAAWRRFKSPAIVVLLSIAYLSQPALHGVNLYDFHSLALAVPIAMWAIYFLDERRDGAYIATLLLLLLVREDMSLLAVGLGLYACVCRRWRVGLLTIVLSLSWLVFVKLLFMESPDIFARDHFAGRYSDFIRPDQGALDLLVAVASNPIRALEVIGTPEKLFYYAALLVPLLGVPLLAPRRLVQLFYPIAFIGLAALRYHWSLHFQYSALVIPILMMATVAGLKNPIAGRLRSFRARTIGLAVGIAVASVLAGVKFGSLAPNFSFRAGWNVNRWSLEGDARRRYETLEEMRTSIREEDPVCASDHVSPHVSNRRTLEKWPKCPTAAMAIVLPKDLRGDGWQKRWKKSSEQAGLVLLERGVPEQDE